MKNRFDTPVQWDDVRVFLAVAMTGTLSAAAQRLDLSVATVSRRLDRLEEDLGLRLFHRSPTGLSLTDAAEPLMTHAQAVMSGMFDFLRAAEGEAGEDGGSVTVHTVDTVVERLLVPHLAAFRAQHPTIQLVLRTSAHVVSLSNRTADIAVRIVPPTEDRVVRQRIATLSYALFASREYLERRGLPATPERDLRGHDLIAYDERLDAMPESVWLLSRANPADIAVRVTTLSSIAGAIEHGAGLGVIPKSMATGNMVCVCEGHDLPEREVWLAVHEDVQHIARVRAVMAFLRERVQSVRDRRPDAPARGTG